jgi:hypothetical protein
MPPESNNEDKLATSISRLTTRQTPHNSIDPPQIKPLLAQGNNSTTTRQQGTISTTSKQQGKISPKSQTFLPEQGNQQGNSSRTTRQTSVPRTKLFRQ